MTLPMPQTERPLTDTPVALPAPVAGAAPAVEQESFVINLCSSTTPMALTQPQLAELKSYRFFVSRRLEDGRERFRLHVGYFDSLLQAEDLLPLVREIYPGAWASEAPGKRLRARALAAAISTPQAPPAPVKPAVTPEAAPNAAILANAPTLKAELDLTLVAPPVLLSVVVEDSHAARQVPALKPELMLESAPAAPAAPAAPGTTEAARAKPAGRAGGSKRDANLPFDQRSNVREVLKSLDESGRARALPAPTAEPAERTAGVLPESQVMHLLEEKRGDPLNTTSTPAAFAVQLQWSVQPIDLAQVPPLAIFGAYMLYTVEGSREGRRWYGLRLGFFSDAHSAKQVAQYVRSEFSSVAVVPVSLKERDGANGAQDGAKGAAPVPAPAHGPTERLPDRTAEFKLLDDTAQTPKLPLTSSSAAAPAAAAGKAAVVESKPPSSPAKAAGRASSKAHRGRGNRVHAQEKRAPKTLEETLEILGADELQFEGAKKKLVSAGAVRHMDVKVQKSSPFSRLLDRLAERNR
ncbi:MAG TPA: hypothetical protein VGG49_06385 [Steroidobacteraceae bacterium]|jgi:hypothetical protein